MKSKLKYSLILALVVLMYILLPLKASAATTAEIAKQLICQCGCYAVLSNCTHGECMVRDSMLKIIDQKLSEGQTAKQIIDTFVVDYGEQVLSAPTKQGFNLTAWILPFVAILAATVAIVFVIRAWVKRGKVEQPEIASASSGEEDEYSRRLDKELNEFTDRGFR